MIIVTRQFWKNEEGYIASAELVLIATIAVLAMVVGLSQVSLAITQELKDMATAFGTVNQGYRYSGLTGDNGLSNGNGFQNSMDSGETGSSIMTSAGVGEG